jgi:cytidine deaminase
MNKPVESSMPQQQVTELIDKALSARALAYTPYSHFAVGAAVLAKSGMIYQGCNIENASYSLTICAERVAIVTAILAGESEFQALAVVADTAAPAAPCGACRQVMAEFHVPLIIMANLAGQSHLETLEKLLPYAFTLADLP